MPLNAVARRTPRPRAPTRRRPQARRDPARRHRRLRRARLLQRPGRRRRPRRRRRRRHRLPLLQEQGRPAGLDLRAQHARRRSADGRDIGRRPAPTRASGCAGSRARHLARLGSDRNLAVVFQVELRQSTKFMERFSSTLLRDYLGLIREAIADGQRAGPVPRRHQADRRRQDALRRARRDGDQLDPQPPPLLARGRRRRGRRPLPQRSASALMATPTMPMRSVAVLGAGTMGAQIAAHFANAGVPVLLLDLTADAAREGLKRARGAQARSVLHRRRRRAHHHRRLRRRPREDRRTPTGSSKRSSSRSTSSARCSSASTPCGARARSSRRTRRAFRSRRSPKAAATTSAGTGSARISSTRRATCGCSRSSRRRTPIAAVVERVSQFADHRLGKGVVLAKDTPNFIANHIGLYGVMQVLRALESGQYTIEEIDAITGPALGRPKSATFRTMDIAGIDILAHVAKNLRFELPPLIGALVERGWVGEKAGQGFYKREKTKTGSEILTLDPATLTYRPKQSARLPCARRRAVDRGRRRADQDAVSRQGQGRPVPARHARADAALHGEGRAGHRLLDRRRRPRDAVGLRLGAGPFEILDAIGAKAVFGDDDAALADASKAFTAGDRFREDGVPPAAADLQTPELGEGSPARRPQERRRQPRRSRRRRARARVPLEDERDRRRHHPDDARRREGGRRELRRARRRQRRAELLGRRQPDAAAPRSAGRQLGRDRPDDPRVPGRDPGAALSPTCR